MMRLRARLVYGLDGALRSKTPVRKDRGPFLFPARQQYDDRARRAVGRRDL